MTFQVGGGGLRRSPRQSQSSMDAASAAPDPSSGLRRLSVNDFDEDSGRMSAAQERRQSYAMSGPSSDMGYSNYNSGSGAQYSYEYRQQQQHPVSQYKVYVYFFTDFLLILIFYSNY